MAGVKSLLKHEVIIQKDIKVMCFDESEAIDLSRFAYLFKTTD